MVRYVLAPINADAARALSLPRTLSGAAGVALTFDDGPHPEGTPAVLETLAAAGARATFFLIGEQVERRPELAARILAEGHAVALHGYRHQLQLRLDLRGCSDDIRRGAGGSPTPSARRRPGTGPIRDLQPGGPARGAPGGLSPLLWSRWGKDWRKFTTPGRIVRRATAPWSAGDVILLHDADFYSAGRSTRTVAALRRCSVSSHGRKLDTVLPV